eukprot:4165823-Prymnesium_polylepis.1
MAADAHSWTAASWAGAGCGGRRFGRRHQTDPCLARALRALRCRVWHEVRVDERTDRKSPCAAHVTRRPVRACVATL